MSQWFIEQIELLEEFNDSQTNLCVCVFFIYCFVFMNANGSLFQIIWFIHVTRACDFQTSFHFELNRSQTHDILHIKCILIENQQSLPFIADFECNLIKCHMEEKKSSHTEFQSYILNRNKLMFAATSCRISYNFFKFTICI